VQQAAVIGAVLMSNRPTSLETASSSAGGSITRDPGTAALVRFPLDARIADVMALRDEYQASIVDGTKGGMFRLQFGTRAMTRGEVAGLLGRSQNEKIVSLAVATP
jgi:hypothetical protein